MINNRHLLILLANSAIVLSFTLGWFFNSTTPNFYPVGTPIPSSSGCDLLSSLTKLCFPSIQFGVFGGTLVLNFDILITLLTASGVVFGLVILRKENPL